MRSGRFLRGQLKREGQGNHKQQSTHEFPYTVRHRQIQVNMRALHRMARQLADLLLFSVQPCQVRLAFARLQVARNVLRCRAVVTLRPDAHPVALLSREFNDI